ncbi:MAG TPA: tail fiber domain-containing protein [Roseiarcus sp.]|nr:tail fiber domain-containing protein [Roseiarcus sp.]
MPRAKVSIILWALLGLAGTALTACTGEQISSFVNENSGWLVPVYGIGGGHSGPSSSSSSSSSGGVVSDRRLKTNIKRIATSPSGLPIYSFRYVSGGPTYVGVLAQDVLKVRPEAVRTDASGYMTVDYDMIDVKMMTLDAYKAMHEATRNAPSRPLEAVKD